MLSELVRPDFFYILPRLTPAQVRRFVREIAKLKRIPHSEAEVEYRKGNPAREDIREITGYDS
jgi:hypothetical protein